MKPFYKEKLFWGLMSIGPVSLIFFYIFKGGFSAKWSSNDIGRFLQITVLASLVEEIVFRGFVYHLLEKIKFFREDSWFITKRNLLVSLLNSVARGVVVAPIWFRASLLPSLIFGYARERFGTVTAPLLIHLNFTVWYYLFFV